MFGLFEPANFRDGQIGELRRSGKYWKGELTIAPCGRFRLALAGGRETPDATALELAKELPQLFESLAQSIQIGLFEHYEPYKETRDAAEDMGSPCPGIGSPEEVWPHVRPAHVLVEPLEGIATVEISFTVVWDIEHTVR